MSKDFQSTLRAWEKETTARQAEREAIMLWLGEQVEADISFSLPVWRIFLWAVFNPFKFGKAVALGEAIQGIDEGRHFGY